MQHRTLITTRARKLRKSMSEPEVMLWSRLRGRSPERPTFRRQHPFGSIILDFYCPSARLAVEVDGSTHWDDAARAKDEARDRWLATQGVNVLRFNAGEIYQDLSRVTGVILLRAEELRLRPTSPIAAAMAGGGPSAERSEEPMVEGASPKLRIQGSPVQPPCPPR
jgi:very-short-patch-repair endonuclease